MLICETKLTFVPSCSQMSLQLLHLHAVFKTWSTFQELTPIVSFRRRGWSQRDFVGNRNIQSKQSKDLFNKIRGLWREVFFASRRCRCRLVCLRSLIIYYVTLYLCLLVLLSAALLPSVRQNSFLLWPYFFSFLASVHNPKVGDSLSRKETQCKSGCQKGQTAGDL